MINIERNLKVLIYLVIMKKLFLILLGIILLSGVAFAQRGHMTLLAVKDING